MKDFCAAVEMMSHGKNKVIYVDRGDGQYLPSIVVALPKRPRSDFFSYMTTGYFPSHVVDGTTYDTIYVAKYPCTVISDKAVSLPLQPPTVGLSYQQMFEAARECNGATNSSSLGWHVMTALEYAYLTILARTRGILGNTGSQAVENAKAVLSPDGHTTLSGTGTVRWNDNMAFDGVADLVGNVFEWAYGVNLDANYRLRFVLNDPSVFDNSAATSESASAVGYYITGETSFSESSTGAYGYSGTGNSISTGAAGTITSADKRRDALSSITGGAFSMCDLVSAINMPNNAYYSLTAGSKLTRGGSYVRGSIADYDFKQAGGYVGFRTAYIG